MKTKITSEMERIILDNYKTKTHQEIANILGNVVCPCTIARWLHKHNIYKEQSIFNDKQIEFIKSNYSNMTITQIANILGFLPSQIKSKICNMKLQHKKRKFNSDYFQNIDSKNKAYFLGLIYADGYISFNKGYYELGITLQSQDKYILEILNQELGGVHIIKHKAPVKKIINGVHTISHDVDELRVYSKKIVMDLIHLGVLPNKTKSSVYPIVPDNYFIDFLRGYIDGDGCFYNNKKYCILHITCANQAPLDWIKDKLKNDYDIKTQVYKLKDKKYRLMCTNKDSMTKLVNSLYYSVDVVCLSRKFDKIKSYLTGFAI